MDEITLEKLAKLVRYYILTSTTEAGSGHPTSSLSATDLMVTLMFGGFFKADLDNPKNSNNDRLIFSKGHAAPLLYSLYGAAGKVSEKELKTLRKSGSKLEGHPTMEFKYTEVPTGSLGQGLSVGVGMALNARIDKLSYSTYVLLGDSEMSEGSVWEAMASAAYYKLNNLVAILDVNRLGQRGETMYGHNLDVYKNRAEAFGWKTWVINGHDIPEILRTFEEIEKDKSEQPKIIIAKTIKGKGVSFLEDKEGWHGKALEPEELDKALIELGTVEKLIGKVKKPTQNSKLKTQNYNSKLKTEYKLGEMVATRKAYGNALVKLVKTNAEVVVLDAEVSNSTMAELVKKEFPEKFFEMYIAEQNMVGVSLGFSRRGKIPFASTFAAFFTRAFDQIRMSQYSDSNIKFAGSHAGVSIGEDGPSQMALEDIALFRSILDCAVLYPSDAVSAEKLTALAADQFGNVYIRTTRAETPIIYDNDEKFTIGGSKILRQNHNDRVTIISAGITLHEALKAYEELQKEKINVRVVDLYSVRPIDLEMLKICSKETGGFIIVEDHHHEGGIGEAILHALQNLLNIQVPVKILSVKKIPKSSKPSELLRYEDIDAKAIIKEVKKIK
ncbi:transketolase [Candidatus Daviesbacteria bacterium]|nr:transketolase [Candidatus Daviesbacteria bacterium]